MSRFAAIFGDLRSVGVEGGHPHRVCSLNDGGTDPRDGRCGEGHGEGDECDGGPVRREWWRRRADCAEGAENDGDREESGGDGKQSAREGEIASLLC